MNFLSKNIVALLILFVNCFFLQEVKATEIDFLDYPAELECNIYQKEDSIKLKITLPEGIKADGNLFKIGASSEYFPAKLMADHEGYSEDLAVRFMADHEGYLEGFELIHIEVHAFTSQDGKAAIFQIEEHLQQITHTMEYINGKAIDRGIKTEKAIRVYTLSCPTKKPLKFRDDVMPKFTYSSKSPSIKYLRFFTKPI